MASPVNKIRKTRRKPRRSRKTEIPKVVHQMGPANPKKWDKWITSWNNTNDFERKYWLDEDLPAVVKKAAPHLYDTWKNMGHWVERADFARYAILWEHGGVYADLDIELKDSKALLDLMKEGKAVFPFEKN